MKSIYTGLPARLRILLAIAMTTAIIQSNAQKARDVIENGIAVRTGKKIFLRKDGNILKYDINDKPQDLTTLSDSSIFLVSKTGVNVYIRPMNPLNFSTKTSNVVIVDPVSEDVAAASKTIFDLLNSIPGGTGLQGEQRPAGTRKNLRLNEPPPAQPSTPPCASFDSLKALLKRIQDSLADNQKSTIVKLFKKLKDMSFEDEEETKSALAAIATEMASIEKHFAEAEGAIRSFNNKIDSICNPNQDISFLLVATFKNISRELQTLETEQKKRLTNLKATYALVKNMQEKASRKKDDLTWILTLDEVPATEGKVSIYTITINESGYKLSDSNEIVVVENKEVIKKTLRIRKFQRFIPEVSAGVANTWLDYKEYGTVLDTASGNLVVAETKVNSIRNIKFTAMINYNYYIPNSPIHPFWQLGVGANSEVPTLFTGFGIRSNMNGIRRIAIAGGIAASWVKRLDKLKLGGKVTGTDDINKDMKYEFVCPKPYIAFQFNF